MPLLIDHEGDDIGYQCVCAAGKVAIIKKISTFKKNPIY